jgi:hypothetical protein
MPRKQRFPPEAQTKPQNSPDGPETRRSGPAPKSRRDRAEAPTIPPPRAGERAPSRRSAADARTSGMRSSKPKQSAHPAATVDEVTADMSKDPRRERDGDEDE